MKKILLKLLIVFFTIIGSDYIVYANDKIILPQKKPVIESTQKSKKIANYLVPPKKPTFKKEEIKNF